MRTLPTLLLAALTTLQPAVAAELAPMHTVAEVDDVINRCRRADGRVDDIQGHAKVVPRSGNARLRVTFFWPFYGDYWVLALDPDYRHVLVGAPSRQYAWVLSRTPLMDESVLQTLLDRAAMLGFDKAAFQRTPQTRPLN